MAELSGNLTGAAKRVALRKAIQSSPDYATARASNTLPACDGKPFEIATASMAQLGLAYTMLYSYAFEGGAHDDPQALADALGIDVKDVETIGKGRGQYQGGGKSQENNGGDHKGENAPPVDNDAGEQGDGKEGGAGKSRGQAKDGKPGDSKGDGKGKGGQGDDGQGDGEENDGDSDGEGSESKEAKDARKEARDKAKSAMSPMEKQILNIAELAVEEHADTVRHGSGGTATMPSFTVRAPMRDPVKIDGLMHYQFPLLLAAVNAGVVVMCVGPAGSGKTTAAEQVAGALKIPFAFTGALNSEYKLSGFIDAQGRIVSTAFRRVYENGGLFLFDEIDGSLPAPVLAFNAALANGHADFPDGAIKRHPDFRAVAAANTHGRGADRQYVGRNQLDAATLDRFATLNWDYDTALESAMVGLARKASDPKPATLTPLGDSDIPAMAVTWTNRVRAIRAAVDATKTRLVVSPRATLNGLKLLTAGWSQDTTEEAVIWRGLIADDRQKVTAAIKSGSRA